MGIKISKINVKDLGPIKEPINWEFKDFNLIYGKNEKGKSLIVEFIIRTLFKSDYKKNREDIDVDWGYLRRIGSGKVVVKGIRSLIENNTTDEYEFFSKDKSPNFLDFLIKSPLNLPYNIQKLFIVKEGEVSIEKNYEEGISLNYIKNIFSMDKVLNDIEENESKIPKNIKNYGYDNSLDFEYKKNIKLTKMGLAKDLEGYIQKINVLEMTFDKFLKSYQKDEELKLKLKLSELMEEKEKLLYSKRYKAYTLSQKLDELREKEKFFNKFEIERCEKLLNEYNIKKEELTKLEQEINQIENEIMDEPELFKITENQLKAKRFKAYSLATKISKIKEELLKYSEEEITKLNNQIELYKKEKEQFLEDESLVKEYLDKTKNYYYLLSLKDLYNKYLQFDKTKVSTKFFGSPISIIIFSTILILLTISSIIFSLSNFNLFIRVVPMIFSFLSGFFLIFSISKFINFVREERRSYEVEKIKKRFESHFGKPLKDITDIDEMISFNQKLINHLEILKPKLQSLSIDLKTLKKQIIEKFESFGYPNLEEEDWNKIIYDIRLKNNDLKERLDQIKSSFEKLDVDPSSFELKDPGIEYDLNIYEETKEKLKKYEILKDRKNKKFIEKEDLKKEIESLKKEINQIFENLLKEKVDTQNWENCLNNVKMQAYEISNEISKIQGELNGLAVDKEEYKMKDNNITFSQQKLEYIEKEIENTKNKIAQIEQNNISIKAELSSKTGLDISSNINELIKRIYQLKEEYLKTKNQVESKIISTILVYESILELKKQEDEKLKIFLQSDLIKSSIKKMTSRYNEISYESIYEISDIKSYENVDTNKNSSKNRIKDFEIFITDGYEKFNVKDISTGAKEQLMLALRIGFLKYLLKNKSGFLILDDAFQHSDYERRKILIDSLIELLKDDWQIFYFTMDDNLKNLIRERIKNSGYELFEKLL